MDRTMTVGRRGGWRTWWLVAVAVLIGGCAGGGERGPANSDQAKQARAQALIDSGNEAYSSGDYRLAVRRFAAAAVVRKEDPAAYYGLGMSLKKLGRDEEARQAYGRARELAHGTGPPLPADGETAPGDERP